MNQKTFIVILFLHFSHINIAQNSSCPEDLVVKKGPKEFYGYVNLFGIWKTEPIFTKAYPFSGDKALVKNGDKMGLINCEGYLILSCEFDKIAPFSEGSVWAAKANQWNLYNAKGKKLTDQGYEDVKEISLVNNNSWVKKKGLYGIFSKETLKFVKDPSFSFIQVMSDTATLVKVGEKFGVIDNYTGEILFDPVISKIRKVNKERIVFEEDKFWGILLNNGKVIQTAQYDSISIFSKDVFLVRKSSKYSFIDLNGKPTHASEYERVERISDLLSVVKSGQKFGAVNFMGKLQISPQFDSLQSFKNKVAVAQKNSLWGIIGTQGNTILGFNYDQINRDLSQNYCVGILKNRHKFIDFNTGKILVPDSFQYIMHTDTAFAVRIMQNSKWGYFNIQNKKWLIEAKYDSALEMKQNICLLKFKSNWGALDRDNKEVLPFIYKNISWLNTGTRNLLLVCNEGKYGLVSPDGKTILTEKYDKLWAVNGNFYKVKLGDKYSILKPNGQPINETLYIEINTPEDEIFAPDWPCIVKEKSKYGLLANNGFYLLPMQYKNISYLGNNLYKIKESKKWGLSNASGQTLTEMVYANVEVFEKDYVLVELDKKFGLINKQGKVLAEAIYDKIEKTNNQIIGIKGKEIEVLVKNSTK